MLLSNSRLSPAFDTRFDWLFMLSIGLLMVRVLLAPESIVVADEYYYAKTAQLWFLGESETRTITSLPGRGEAGFPNYLFFAIYQWAFALGDNFYVATKIINVSLVALMALAVRRTATSVAGPVPGLWIAVLVMWLPSSSYYSYFMAEALYECLVWWGIALFVGCIAERRAMGFALLGGFLGAAFLAKPNAAALLVAANASALAIGWCYPGPSGRWRDMITGAGTVTAAFLVTAYGLNVVTTGHLAWDPVGKFYQTGLSKFSEVSTSTSFVYVTFKYLAAYVFAVVLVFGPALTVAWAARRTLTADRQTFAFSVLTTLGLGALLLGSVKAAVNWERVYDNHQGVYSTRYMSVLFPLLLIGLVKGWPEAVANRSARRVAGVILAVLGVVLVMLFRNIDNTFQMREVYWPTHLHWFGYYLVAGLLLVMTLHVALSVRPRIAAYAGLLAVWAAGSSFALTRTDIIDATLGPAGRFARIARITASLVRSDYLDKGFIISSDRKGAILFMFRFPGIVGLRLVDATDPMVREGAIPATAWQIYLGSARPERTEGCTMMDMAVLCISDPKAAHVVSR